MRVGPTASRIDRCVVDLESLTPSQYLPSQLSQDRRFIAQSHACPKKTEVSLLQYAVCFPRDVGEENEIHSYPTMKLFVDGAVFDYDGAGRRWQPRNVRFALHTSSSVPAKVAADRQVGQSTSRERPCAEVCGGSGV